MNLCTLAESDNSITLEDSANGFGRAIKLTDPQGFVYNVTGQINRIGVMTDPDTGLSVPGKTVSMTVRYSAIGEDVDEDWMVSAEDINGGAIIGRPTGVMIDKALGRITFNVRRGA